MKVCRTCQATYGSHVKFCPTDGSALEVQGLGDDPLVGRTLAERYQILERLGAGGFGTVYRAKDTRMDDIEALKVFDRRRLPPGEAQEAIERFRREAKVLRKLGRRSVHIVGVTNFEEDREEDLLYFSMEYVPGENLAQVLIREERFDLNRCLVLGRQICSALVAAHRDGIIHRDLKLENVMLAQEGEREVVKILDFGIAKILGHGSLTDMRVGAPGTPGYAAPEQIENPAVIDGRTDLFALGVVLYAMLTGREPWMERVATAPTTESWITLIQKTLNDEPTPARNWVPDIPKELDSLLLRLMSKAQADRPESAEAVDQALAAIQESMHVESPGSLRIVTETEGVEIALRKGLRTVAKGSTPWHVRSLKPGAYRVAIRDRRYESERRDVEVRSDSELEVHLTATPRPEREPIAALAGGYARRHAGTLTFLFVALAGFALWPRPAPQLSPELLRRNLEDGNVARLELDGDRLRGRLITPLESGADFQVSLAGLPLQQLAAFIDSRGVPFSVRGHTVIQLRPAGEAAAGAEGLMLGLESDRDRCVPCDTGEHDLTAGWYSIAESGPEWDLESVTVRDGEGALLEETLTDSAGLRLFLPPDRRVELALSLTRTELGRTMADARAALAAGHLLGEGDDVWSLTAEALRADPDYGAALELRRQAVAGVHAAAGSALAAGNLAAAEERLGVCQQLAPEHPGCAAVSDGIESARAERVRLAALAAEQERRQSAESVSGSADGQDADDAPVPARTATRPSESAPQRDRPAERRAGLADPAPEPPAQRIPAEDSEPVGATAAGRAATTAPGPGGAGSTPAATPTAAAVRDLVVLEHGIVDRSGQGIHVVAGMRTEGGAGTPWCAAMVVNDEDGRPVRAQQGRSPGVLGGQVGTTREITAGPESAPASPVDFFVPVNVVEVDRMGVYRFRAVVRVWDRPCTADLSGRAPLASSDPVEVCLTRYAFGWGECR